MKKGISETIVAVVLFAASTGVSQADESARFNVKLGAHGGGFGFGPALELKVAPQFSISAMTEGVSLSTTSVDASSFGYGFSARRYFNSALTTDSYLNLGFFVGNAEASDSVNSVTADVASVAFTIGKTWMNNGWNFDSSIGFRNISIDNMEVSRSVDTTAITDLEGAGLSIGLAVGYAF